MPQPRSAFPRLLARGRASTALILVSLLSACAGAGPYSFSRDYEPLSAEDEHYEATEDNPVSIEQVRRDPHTYKTQEIAWFGVVEDYADQSDGRVRLTLSLRAHQARHLCTTEEESSCRVTVSEKDLGKFTVVLKLTPEETLSKERIWVGSLLRIYGHATDEYDDATGPVLDVTYYRHFPRGKWVTTASRGAMRR